jgi:hypothetical protein
MREINFKTELEDVRLNAASYITSQRQNLKSRYCIWEGQSQDGRRHADDIGEEPVPWENAADNRVFLIDDIINEQVATELAAFESAEITAQPVGFDDAERAQVVTEFMRWVVRGGPMKDEALDEVELLLQWGKSHGVSLMLIDWIEERALEKKSMNIKQWFDRIIPIATEAGIFEPGLDLNGVVQVFASLEEEQRIQLCCGLFKTIEPGVSDARIKKAVKDLLAGAEVEFLSEYVKEQRPRWRALRLYHDVFYPTGTTDLQRAEWVAVREFVTEFELDERKERMGWTEEWVEAVKDTKYDPQTYEDMELRDGNKETYCTDAKGQKEIFHIYYKDTDEDGIPAIYHKTICLNVSDDLLNEAKVLDYAHGKYPLAIYERERIERGSMEQRGIPRVAQTQQNEIKMQRDVRTDISDITGNPPLEIPVALGKYDFQYQPGARNYTRQGGSLSLSNLPKFPSESIEIEKATLSDVNNYFGRDTADVPATKKQLYQQRGVSRLFKTIREAMSQTLALCQQFMTEAQIVRVMGEESLPFLKVDREDIRGRFDLTINFDARNLDLSYVKEKMNLISTILLPVDSFGQVDRSKILEWGFSSIDPRMARAVIQDRNSATQKEVDDEKTEIIRMANGIESNYRESGVNAQLRLQVLNETIQKSPKLMQQYQQDEIFKKLVDARMQNLQQILNQEQNKVIGRTGVKPVL